MAFASNLKMVDPQRENEKAPNNIENEGESKI